MCPPFYCFIIALLVCQPLLAAMDVLSPEFNVPALVQGRYLLDATITQELPEESALDASIPDRSTWDKEDRSLALVIMGRAARIESANGKVKDDPIPYDTSAFYIASGPHKGGFLKLVSWTTKAGADCGIGINETGHTLFIIMNPAANGVRKRYIMCLVNDG